MHPALRQDIAHGASDSLKALAWAGGHQFDDVVENEMPFIERVIGSREPNRPAAVLLDELGHLIGSGWLSGNWTLLRLCFHQMSLSELVIEFPHSGSLIFSSSSPSTGEVEVSCQF